MFEFLLRCGSSITVLWRLYFAPKTTITRHIRSKMGGMREEKLQRHGWKIVILVMCVYILVGNVDFEINIKYIGNFIEIFLE